MGGRGGQGAAAPRPRVIRRQEPRPFFDPWYLGTAEGGLKVVQILACLATLVSVVMIHGGFEGTYFVAIVAVSGFTASLILLCMYLYNLVALVGGKWVQGEKIFDGVMIGALVLCGGLMGYSAWAWPTFAIPWGASGVFALIAALAYGGDIYLKMRAGRRPAAQGGGQAGGPPDRAQYTPAKNAKNTNSTHEFTI